MCCVLIFVSVGVTSVRVQDRLIYFLNMFGAFSAYTVRGLLYMKLIDLLFSYLLQMAIYEVRMNEEKWG